MSLSSEPTSLPPSLPPVIGLELVSPGSLTGSTNTALACTALAAYLILLVDPQLRPTLTLTDKHHGSRGHPHLLGLRHRLRHYCC